MSDVRSRGRTSALRNPTSGPTETGGDAALVGAIAEGDRAALAEAYAEHGSRVHALVLGVCGDARADDLTREVFLRLWNFPRRYRPDQGSLRGYLLMQAHSRAVDVLRRDSVRTAKEDVAAPAPAAPTGDPDPTLVVLERAAVDKAAAAALPEVERQPIVLAYFGGHTYREVATLLDVPEETVKSRIRSGLDRLRSSAARQ